MRTIKLFLLLLLCSSAHAADRLVVRPSYAWAYTNLLANTNLFSGAMGQALVFDENGMLVPGNVSATIEGDVPDPLTITNLTVLDALNINNFNATNLSAQRATAQSFTVVGMPLDIRTANAVVNTPVTNNTDAGLIATFKGDARTALETAIATGYSNIYFPAGKWNLYQGVDGSSTYRPQGITIDRDITIQGVPGQTILDFGRPSDALQVEFVHLKGKLRLRDLIIRRANYLIAERLDGRPVDAEVMVDIDNCDVEAANLIAPMWTPYGAWGGNSDIYRTNILAATNWVAGDGWTESGGVYTYSQPAAIAAISTVGRTNYLATFTTSAAHGLSVGDWVEVDCSNDAFDSAVPTRVFSVPTTSQFTFYQSTGTSVGTVAATGDVWKCGKLTAPHSLTIRPGDLIRDRIKMSVTSSDGSGVYLYAGGALSNARVQGLTNNASRISRAQSTSPYWTSIEVAGHRFSIGDRIRVNTGGVMAFYDTNVFTVSGFDNASDARIRCLPALSSMTTSTTPFPVYFAEFAVTNIALVGNVATVSCSTNHGYSVGSFVTIQATDAGAALYTNRTYQIMSIPATNTFTIRYNSGLGGGTTVVTNGYVTQELPELSVAALGYDSDIYLVPDRTFAGSVLPGAEIWVANWPEYRITRTKLHVPPELCANIRGSGVVVSSGYRSFVVENSTFSGGSQMLYLNKPDSLQVTYNSADYARRTIVRNSIFRGIGLANNLNARALYFFGRNLLVDGCEFDRVGFGTPGLTQYGSRQAIYLASDYAVIQNSSFFQCGDSGPVIISKVGASPLLSGIWTDTSGNPRNYGIFVDQCNFDGYGSVNTDVFVVDGRPDLFRISNTRVAGFPKAADLIDVTSNVKGVSIELVDSVIRNMPALNRILGDERGGRNRLRVNRNEFDDLRSVSSYISTKAPELVEFNDNYISSRDSSKSLMNSLLAIAADTDYQAGSVAIQRNRTAHATNWVFGSANSLVSLPAGGGVTVTNLLIADNKLGTGDAVIENLSANSVQNLVVLNNNDTPTLLTRSTGVFWRTNGVEVAVPVIYHTDATPPTYPAPGNLWVSNAVQVFVYGTNAAWVPVNNP